MNLKRRLFFTVCSLLIACAKKPTDGEATSVIAGSDLSLASAILKESSLMRAGVPFGFAADGCYARSLIMAAKLAAAGIPSSSLFAFAPNHDALSLRNAKGELIQWRYHVAPLFFSISSVLTGGQIIDPSVNGGSSTPVAVEEWLGKFNGNRPSVSLFMTPGSCYVARLGKDQQCNNLTKILDRAEPPQSQRAGLVRTIQEMPKFHYADLNFACMTLGRYNILAVQPKDVNNANSVLSKNLSTVVKLLESKGLVQGSKDDFACEMRFVMEGLIE